MKRVVFATFGSLGDVHPYVALALELTRRGHHPLIVTSDRHREAVERAGIEFAPMRPGAGDLGDPAERARKIFHPTRGTEYMMREILMPYVRDAYGDLDRACARADLVVSHPLAFAARLVAEKRGLAWCSTVLSPMSLMSAIDPPLFGPAPWLLWLRRLGLTPYRSVFAAIKRSTAEWETPLRELRSELGLRPMRSYALFEGQYAPVNLALFSRVLAEPQPDWPAGTTVCGFSRYDGQPAEGSVEAELDAFIAAGSAPIVFTLGSSVSMYASGFFEIAIEAARRLERRAILVTGRDPAQCDAAIAASGISAHAVKVFRYLPYSRVFPCASVIVHQGGAGTLAQALAAGKPQLIVPVGFDQPDYARRARRLGLARAISFRAIDVRGMTIALGDLLASRTYTARAAEIARTVLAEEREQRAVDLLAR